MNYGMPGAAGPPNGAANGPSQQQSGGAAGGYPGASAGGPGPQQQQQHMQMSMQQKLHLHHSQQMQHLTHSLHSGQISQAQYSNMVATHNIKMQTLWAQHGSQQPRYPPQSEAWRMQQQQQAAHMQKEPQSAMDRKKYAAYMEMQKRNAAAAAAAGHHQMMMARQQSGYPPQAGGQPPPGMMTAGRMAMHQGQMMYPGGPPSVHGGPASVTPMPSQAMQHGGPPSVQSTINASPQLMHSLQPSTPRYQEHGPPSIPAPGSVPQPSSVSQDDPQTVEYMKLLREMKSEYLERIKAIDERCKMEKVPKPKGIQQILEILEERRRVPIATLEKVRPSLVILVSRDCLTFPLMDEIRRQLFDDKEQRDKLMAQTQKRMETANEEPSTSTAFLSSAAIASNSSDDEDGAENEGQNFVRKLSDNWKSFRHRRIRVPKFVKELLAEHYEKVNHRKRKNDETEEETMRNEDTVETKRARTEEESEGMEVEEICDPKYQIPCLFDNRKPWNMPKMAQNELENLKGWSIDELCLPACSNTPFVVVCIKSSLFLCSPLRIAIPRGYPHEPAAVQFDRSFPQSTLLGTQLQKVFEKWIGIRPAARSITDYAEAFNSACAEMKMYRQAAPVLNGVSAPIVAPEYDAVVVSANTTSKIAQKGMVA